MRRGDWDLSEVETQFSAVRTLENGHENHGVMAELDGLAMAWHVNLVFRCFQATGSSAGAGVMLPDQLHEAI